MLPKMYAPAEIAAGNVFLFVTFHLQSAATFEPIFEAIGI